MSRADFLQLRTSRWRYLGLVILLGICFAQSIAASPRHSVTFDEQYHLTPGYVYLTQRDLQFHHDQNPPLYEAILAAPLLARTDIHLPIDQTGNIVAQDDRFGAAARMLEPGDLIVQRHPIQSEAPLKPGAYQIAIGLYNPDTLSRFKTQDGIDRLLLRTIEVKPQ